MGPVNGAISEMCVASVVPKNHNKEQIGLLGTKAGKYYISPFLDVQKDRKKNKRME